MSTTPPTVSFSTLIAGDAIAAGMTIRALVHAGHVPPGATEIMQRVGDWLVAAAGSLPAKSGDPGSTKLRASEVVTAALNTCAQDPLDAFQALVTGAATMALRCPLPGPSLQIAIDALLELQERYAEAATSSAVH